jgi:hypothetical protein
VPTTPRRQLPSTMRTTFCTSKPSRCWRRRSPTLAGFISIAKLVPQTIAGLDRERLRRVA